VDFLGENFVRNSKVFKVAMYRSRSSGAESQTTSAEAEAETDKYIVVGFLFSRCSSDAYQIRYGLLYPLSCSDRFFFFFYGFHLNPGSVNPC
jgi:hypothetical protein